MELGGISMKFSFSLLLAATLASIAAPADKKLAIVRPLLSQTEDGAPVSSGFEFVPGETIHFSCQIEGYKGVEDKTEEEKILLTYQMEARDPHGVLLQPVQEGKEGGTVTSEDKNWRPKIRESIVIPALAESGQYQILLKVKDEMAQSTAEVRAAFTVKGVDVPPSDTLVVRNFRFLRNEEDDKPLQVAAYRAGDAVWARFNMTGYKLGEANQFDIEYGLQVLRADGSVAYSQPQAANEKEQTFYPQRYQPGALSLNLAKDQKPGQYTIVLTVRDNLGKQSYETREKFTVE
jgi:hypothetical protein